MRFMEEKADERHPDSFLIIRIMQSIETLPSFINNN